MRIFLKLLDLFNRLCISKRFSKLKAKISGKYAYNFNLPDTLSKRVQLSEFKGKVVFIDFWYTGCTNCVEFYKKRII